MLMFSPHFIIKVITVNLAIFNDGIRELKMNDELDRAGTAMKSLTEIMEDNKQEVRDL